MNTKRELTMPIENQLKQIEYERLALDLHQKRGELLAKSTLIPEVYRGNVADCTQICYIANKFQLDPYTIACETYVVHGRAAFSAKFLVSLLNRSGVLEGRLKYKSTGEPNSDSWGCIAYGTDVDTGDVIEGPEITLGMAKAEGWYSRAGSKWKTMPSLMLNYRAAAFFIRTYYPEILAGYTTVEEAKDSDEREIKGEVTRRSKFSPEPQKDDDIIAITDKGEKVDTKTGEIIEHDKETEPKLKPEQTNDSAAFVAISEKLSKTKTTDEINALRRNPLFNRCKASEKTRFDSEAKKRFDSMQAELANN